MFGLELLDLLSQAQDDVSGARGRSALGDERDGGKHGDDRHRHNRGEGTATGPPPGRLSLSRGAIRQQHRIGDRKSTRLNSSHTVSSYAVFCLKKKTTQAT